MTTPSNPLNFDLEHINKIIDYLQSEYDLYLSKFGDTGFLCLEESGVSIEFSVRGKGTFSYSLEQCKKLQIEMTQPKKVKLLYLASTPSGLGSIFAGLTEDKK